MTPEDWPKRTKAMISEGYVTVDLVGGPQVGTRRHYFDLQETSIAYAFKSGRRDTYTLAPPVAGVTRGSTKQWHWAYRPDLSRGPGGRPITDDDIALFKSVSTPGGRKRLAAKITKQLHEEDVAA